MLAAILVLSGTGLQVQTKRSDDFYARSSPNSQLSLRGGVLEMEM